MTEEKQACNRLRDFIDVEGLSQTALAQIVGVTQGYMNQVFVGKKRLSATIIIAIAKRFTNLNLRWLLLGEGEMYEPGATTVSQKPAGAVSNAVAEPSAIYNKTEGDVLTILADHETRLKRLEGG